MQPNFAYTHSLVASRILTGIDDRVKQTWFLFFRAAYRRHVPHFAPLRVDRVSMLRYAASFLFSPSHAKTMDDRQLFGDAGHT